MPKNKDFSPTQIVPRKGALKRRKTALIAGATSAVLAVGGSSTGAYFLVTNFASGDSKGKNDGNIVQHGELLHADAQGFTIKPKATTKLTIKSYDPATKIMVGSVDSANVLDGKVKTADVSSAVFHGLPITAGQLTDAQITSGDFAGDFASGAFEGNVADDGKGGWTISGDWKIVSAIAHDATFHNLEASTGKLGTGNHNVTPPNQLDPVILQHLKTDAQTLIDQAKITTSTTTVPQTIKDIDDLLNKNASTLLKRPVGVIVKSVPTTNTGSATFEINFEDGYSVVVNVPMQATDVDLVAAAQVACSKSVDDNSWNKLTKADFVLDAAAQKAGVTVDEVFAPSILQPSSTGMISYNVSLKLNKASLIVTVPVKYAALTAAQVADNALNTVIVTPKVKLHETGWQKPSAVTGNEIAWVSRLNKTDFDISNPNVTFLSATARSTEPTSDTMVIFDVNVKYNDPSVTTTKTIQVPVEFKSPAPAVRDAAILAAANVVPMPGTVLDEASFDKADKNDFFVAANQAITIKSVHTAVTAAPNKDGMIAYDVELALNNATPVIKHVDVPYVQSLPKISISSLRPLVTDLDWDKLSVSDFYLTYLDAIAVPGVTIKSATPPATLPSGNTVDYDVVLEYAGISKHVTVSVPKTVMTVNITTAKTVTELDWDSLKVKDFQLQVTPSNVTGAVIVDVTPPSAHPSQNGNIKYVVSYIYQGVIQKVDVNVPFTISANQSTTQKQAQDLIDKAGTTVDPNKLQDAVQEIYDELKSLGVVGVTPPALPITGNGVFEVQLPNGTTINVSLPVVLDAQGELANITVASATTVDDLTWNKLQVGDFAVTSSTGATGFVVTSVFPPTTMPTTDGPFKYSVIVTYKGTQKTIDATVNFAHPTTDVVDTRAVQATTVDSTVTLHETGWSTQSGNTASATNADWTQSLPATAFHISDPSVTFVSASTTSAEPTGDAVVVFDVTIKKGNSQPRVAKVPVSYKAPSQAQKDLAILNTIDVVAAPGLKLNEANFDKATPSDFAVISSSGATIDHVSTIVTTAPAANGNIQYSVHIILNGQDITKTVDVPYERVLDKLGASTTTFVTDNDWDKLLASDFNVVYPNGQFIPGVTIMSVTPPTTKPTSGNFITYSVKLALAGVTVDTTFNVPLQQITADVTTTKIADENNWNNFTLADFNLNVIAPTGLQGVALVSVTPPATKPSVSGTITYVVTYRFRNAVFSANVTVNYQSSGAQQTIDKQVQDAINNANITVSDSSQVQQTVQQILQILADAGLNPQGVTPQTPLPTNGNASFDVHLPNGQTITVTVPVKKSSAQLLADAKVTTTSAVDYQTWKALISSDFTLNADPSVTIDSIYPPMVQPSATGNVTYLVKLKCGTETLVVSVNVPYTAPTAAQVAKADLDKTIVTAKVTMHQTGWSSIAGNTASDTNADWNQNLTGNYFDFSSNPKAKFVSATTTYGEPAVDGVVVYVVTLEQDGIQQSYKVVVPFNAPLAADVDAATLNNVDIIADTVLDEGNFDSLKSADFRLLSNEPITIDSVTTSTTTPPAADGTISYQVALTLRGKHTTRTIAVPFKAVLGTLSLTTTRVLCGADWNQLSANDITITYPSATPISATRATISKITPPSTAPASSVTTFDYTVTLQMGKITRDVVVHVGYVNVTATVTKNTNSPATLDENNWNSLTNADFVLTVTPTSSSFIISSVVAPATMPTSDGNMDYTIKYYLRGALVSTVVKVPFKFSDLGHLKNAVITSSKTLKYNTWNQLSLGDLTSSDPAVTIKSVTPPKLQPLPSYRLIVLKYQVKLSCGSTEQTFDFFAPYTPPTVTQNETWKYGNNTYTDRNLAITAATVGERARITSATIWSYQGVQYATEAEAQNAQFSKLLGDKTVQWFTFKGVTVPASGTDISTLILPVYVYNGKVYISLLYAQSAWVVANPNNPTIPGVGSVIVAKTIVNGIAVVKAAGLAGVNENQITYIENGPTVVSGYQWNNKFYTSVTALMTAYRQANPNEITSSNTGARYNGAPYSSLADAQKAASDNAIALVDASHDFTSTVTP